MNADVRAPQLATSPRHAAPSLGGREAGRSSGLDASASAARRAKRAAPPYVFLAPFFLSFLAFTVVPLGYAIYSSFYHATFFGGKQFVGLDNYGHVFSSAVFWGGVLRVLLYGLVQVPVMLGLALFFAVIFDLALVRFTGSFYRVLYFLPYAVPGVISTLMWGYLYDQSLSPFDAVFGRLGLGHPDLVSSTLVLPAIGNIDVWQFVGFNMVIFYVTLKAIPPDLNDAAIVDGARLWQLVRYIRLPMIKMALWLTGLMSVIGTLQLFTEPEILSSFTSAINSTYTPNIMIYNVAFEEQDINYAAALSLVIGGITIVVSLAVLVVGRRRRGRRLAG